MIHKNDVIDEKGLGKMFLIYKQEKNIRKTVWRVLADNYTPPKNPNQTKPKQTNKNTLEKLD